MVASPKGRLHRHDFPTDPNIGSVQIGWTQFTLASAARAVYVSTSTGDDGYDGFYPEPILSGPPPYHGPKKTIGAARALLRQNVGDWLLLKAGDAFVDAANNNLRGWNIGGLSAAYPTVIGGYGDDARAWIKSANQNGFDCFAAIANVAIVSLRFTPHTRNPATDSDFGIYINWGGAGTGASNFLVEDCLVEQYGQNILFFGNAQSTQGGSRIANMVLRQSIIVDAYSTGTLNAQGIYAEGTDGLLIENNVFDGNGWGFDNSMATWYRRNAYIQNGNTGLIVRGNVFSGTDGVQLRCGGIAQNNLFLKAALGLEVGDGNTPDPGGVPASVTGNIFLDAGDLGLGFAGGTWTDGTKTLTKTGAFKHYTFVSGDHVWINSGTGATAGQYSIASRVSDDAVTLTASIGAGADGHSDIAFTLVTDANQADHSQGGGVRGWGYLMGNVNGGMTFGNVWANNVSSHGPRGWELNFNDGAQGSNHGVGITNTVFDSNIVYKWPTTGNNNLVDPGYDQIPPFTNNRFIRNDFQDYTGTPYMVWMPNTSYIAGFGGATASGEANRWYSSGGNASRMFGVGGTNYTFAAFMALIGDTQSTNAQATYSDADNATAGAFFTYQGGAHSITPDGTIGTYLAALRLQAKNAGAGGWDYTLMPCTPSNSASAGTPYNQYPLGTVRGTNSISGPIRWLRQKFNTAIAAQKVSVSGVVPATGAAAGGTPVTINGTGFASYCKLAAFGMTVAFDNVTIDSPIVVSDTVITGVTQAHAAGAVDVTVDNGDGIYTKASAFTFT